MVIPEYQ